MPRGDTELDPSLRDKAVRGVFGSGLTNWGEPIISLAAFLIVVRTIGAEAYGLFGMALLVVALGELLVSSTLTDSLVQGRDLSSSHSDSVFWAILAFGIALTIGVALVSGPLAAGAKCPGRRGHRPLPNSRVRPTRLLLQNAA